MVVIGEQGKYQTCFIIDNHRSQNPFGITDNFLAKTGILPLV